MKNWKRNAVIAAAVLLVGGGVLLNWKLTDKGKTPLTDTLDAERILDDARFVVAPVDEAVEVAAEAGPNNALSEAAYFAQLRLSRQESRDGAVELLQETIAYAGEGEEAATSTAQLNDIVDLALREAQIESLVISKGFSDCVAYMNEEGISLAVPAKENGLTDSDVALLTDIITSQSDYPLDQIRIIEVQSD